MILEEFDNCEKAMLNASDYIKRNKRMPKIVVSFFEYKMLKHFVKTFMPKLLFKLNSSIKPINVYGVNVNGTEIAVVQAGVGGPFCVSIFEELVALGAENILLFGSCGTLVPLDDYAVIVPFVAVRDEGTSFHYLPASDEVELDKNIQERLLSFFKNNGIAVSVGKTWTTDAIYRETKGKIELRKKMGCVCVEMECSSMAAFAKFKGVSFSTFFYTGDNLENEKWQEGKLFSKDLSGKDKLVAAALNAATIIF